MALLPAASVCVLWLCGSVMTTHIRPFHSTLQLWNPAGVAFDESHFGGLVSISFCRTWHLVVCMVCMCGVRVWCVRVRARVRVRVRVRVRMRMRMRVRVRVHVLYEQACARCGLQGK